MRGTPSTTDYRGIFVLGVCLLGTGVALKAAIGPAFISFLGTGIIFIAIGLSNRVQWTKTKVDRR
jgi:hypothetical protein